MRPVLALILAAALAGCATSASDATAQAPAGGGMVAAANPLAVEAGLKVLRAGGSAVDAAVAVQATLGLVEPQSSGLAGGAFMVVYDARTKKVTAYDGRETAPAGASPTMFLGEGGRPLPFGQAVSSGRSTGTPGVVAMLALAHADHGRLAWKDLFGEAERLARDGFPAPGRLAAAASRDQRPDIQSYAGAVKAGETLKNPAYAQTVRAIADGGPRAFYEGPIAAAIAARVATDPIPGALSTADLAAYRARESEALCRPYRIYVVCVPGAPSGGPGVLMALGILENTDVAQAGPTVEGWYQFAEASRLMYADRDQYVADPAFVDVPLAGLLDPAYLKGRAALIGPRSEPRTPGTPAGARRRGADATDEVPGTSHFVVVDAAGDVVSITTSVESSFGSGRMAAGMVLNNQMTDFSFTPTGPDGAAIANAVAPGKRPRSSMSPVIVLDRQGRFVAALGSPGGMSIPAYNVKALVGLLDWKLSLQQAFDLPNVVARGANTAAETDKFSPDVVAGLAARGVVLRGSSAEGSGFHGVVVRDGRLEGAADKRREGVALAP
jgi:gamma-glutamyltranspeptidase/glutathione hydrolase